MKKWKVKFIIGGVTGETVVVATTADIAREMIKKQYAMINKSTSIISCEAL